MKKKLSSLLILSSLLVMTGCSEDTKTEPKEDIKKEEVVKKETKNEVVTENYDVKQEEVFFNNEKIIYFEQGERPNDYGLHVTPLNYLTLNEVSNKSGKVTKAKEGNVFLVAEFNVENKGKSPIKMTGYLTNPFQITFESGYTYSSDGLLTMDYEYITGIEAAYIDKLNPLESFTDRALFEVNESLLQESFILEIVEQNVWEGDTPIKLIEFKKQ